MKHSILQNSIATIISALLLLLGWKVLAMILGLELILPSPETTAVRFFQLLGSPRFWPAVLATLWRGIIGFFLAFAGGLIVGIAAGLFPFFRACVNPILTVIKSTPVISIILLALIWFHTNWVPVFVAFLMTFPIICGSTISGVQGVDSSLVQMAKSYSVSRGRLFYGVYLPSIAPAVVSGASTALGITWKVVIAAEVLAMPLQAVGTRMQNSRINLETAEVFAWTLVSIILSSLGEFLMNLLAKRVNWYDRNKN